MKRLSNRKLKIVRNAICAIGIIVGFILWKCLPTAFENTQFFHVGNGKYGSKAGALLLLLLQFVAFIPYKDTEEIHTEDPQERVKIQEARDKNSLKQQVVMAIAMALVIWGVMGLAVSVL